MARDIGRFNSCVWNDWMSAQEARLPHLDDVEQVTDRVVRIMGGNPGSMQLQGTNTYLVGTGHSRILIDTGEGKPLWITNLLAHLATHSLTLSHVLLTHWHGDHTGGVPDLIAHDPSLASRIYKHTPDPGQHPISHGSVFSVEGATVRAIHTPGHAIDHMCFVLEEESALFTGDNVLGHGFSVEEDLGAYMRSLEGMRGEGCRIGYPAHGVRIEDLEARLDMYIRQKEAREAQVVDALPRRGMGKMSGGGGGGGGMGGVGVTSRELVKELYGELPPDVVSLAVEPCVSQVLWKLAEERKVGFACIKGSRQWFFTGRGGNRVVRVK